MFGYLEEAEVERILREGSTFPEDVAWSRQRNNANWMQFGGFLDSPIESSLRLNMAVSLFIPERHRLVLLRGDQPIRRLCVRGNHRNPRSASGEVWLRRTHKHRWSDGLADKVAYSPADIVTDAFDAAEYERVFRAFCAECNIEFGGRWRDPPTHVQQRLNI